MLQTRLQTGVRDMTEGMQGSGRAEKWAALGRDERELLNQLCQEENVLWTTSFSIANTAIPMCTCLHEPWKQTGLSKKCVVYKRDILNGQQKLSKLHMDLEKMAGQNTD